MTALLTIPFQPDNRDVYHTLDGRALFGFRFEQETRGWSIYAEHLPRELRAKLAGPRPPVVQVGLAQPPATLREAKGYAAQWAEQLWRDREAPYALSPVRDVRLIKEHDYEP